MKTIEISIYKFSELSDKAKETAINHFRETEFDSEPWYIQEAGATFEKFADIFGLTRWSIDYLEPHRNEYKINIDDDVLALKGIRLMAYLWNNYRSDLFKGRYYSVKSDKRIFHKRVKSKELKNRPGHYFNAYYSAIQMDHSCVLTGVCYDDDILAPIYEFLKKPSDRIDFETLINDCVYSLCSCIQNEYEYHNSDEGITEMIEANDYDFTANGELY